MQATSLFRLARTALLDLVFPPRCQGCGRHGAWFCEVCIASLKSPTARICPRCGRSLPESVICPDCRRHPLSPALSGIRSIDRFDGALRNAIHALKYNHVTVLAEPLAALLAQTAPMVPQKASLIVPVPLHKEREAERGYNQSALLASALGRLVGIPVDRHVLVRQRNTIPQVRLDGLQRRSNLIDAFRCVRRLDGSHILLIDDVCTTGATLSECAQALRAAGATTVWGLTLAD